jgi:hypothetical protein
MQSTTGATSLKLLLDTNAFIALEPTSTAVERGPEARWAQRTLRTTRERCHA